MQDSGTAADHSTPDFVSLADLASARLGGRAIAANDDFFAPRSNLLKPEAPIFLPGKFTTRGKWMDGWESRRRRTPGHDWCVVRLGVRGSVRGVDVDTSFFTGNFPSHCSIDALDTTRVVGPVLAAKEAEPWTTLLEKSPLSGNRHNYFAIPAGDRAWTHLRLNIFPDGGVARLRVYGEVAVDWSLVDRKQLVDLAAVTNGGRAIACSDQHYGSPMLVLYPGRGVDMGDGWETRRRREPGNDWAIFALGH